MNSPIFLRDFSCPASRSISGGGTIVIESRRKSRSSLSKVQLQTVSLVSIEKKTLLCLKRESKSRAATSVVIAATAAT